MDGQLDQHVRSMLQAHEQRYTTGRQSIVAALARAGRPVTLPELMRLDTTLSTSSTYRNLALMEEAGVVRRLVHTGHHAHFELAEALTRHHHHLVCEGCGDIRDVTFDAAIERSLRRRFEQLAEGEAFHARGHAIDVFGRCAACA